ncbi:StbA protein, partial [Desulfacinum hydrothermale DSM 13146]
MYIGIDLGYGWTKVAYGMPDDTSNLLRASQIKFPTAIAPILDKCLHSSNMGTTDRVVTYQNQAYQYGHNALASPNCLHGADLEWMLAFGPVLFAGAIDLVSPANPSGHNVAVGLPPADYTQYREQLVDAFSQFHANGREYHNNVEVYPQAVVALGEWRARGNSTDDLLIVDIGYNTVDVVPVANGQVQGDAAGTIDRMGIGRVYQDARSALRKTYGVVLNDAKVDRVFATGKVVVNGAYHDASDIVRDTLHVYRTVLTNALMSRWGQHIRSTENMLYIGGGASFLVQFAGRELANWEIQTLPEPEFANAR